MYIGLHIIQHKEPWKNQSGLNVAEIGKSSPVLIDISNYIFKLIKLIRNYTFDYIHSHLYKFFFDLSYLKPVHAQE